MFCCFLLLWKLLYNVPQLLIENADYKTWISFLFFSHAHAFWRTSHHKHLRFKLVFKWKNTLKATWSEPMDSQHSTFGRCLFSMLFNCQRLETLHLLRTQKIKNMSKSIISLFFSFGMLDVYLLLFVSCF